MAGEGFNLPGSSFDELKAIIQAYLYAGEGAGLEQVAKVAGTRPETISRNNKFLFDSGVLEGTTQNRQLSEVGSALAQALQHDQEEEARSAWRTLVESTEFLSQILSAVRVRNGMDADSLQSHIAFSSGRPKSKVTTTGARTVAAILQASGLLKDLDGKFVYSSSPDQSLRGADPRTSRATAPRSGAVSGRFYGGSPVPQDPNTISWSSLADRWDEPATVVAAASGFSIQIQIQASVDDLEGLGPRIRQLMADISQPPQVENHPDNADASDD